MGVVEGFKVSDLGFWLEGFRGLGLLWGGLGLCSSVVLLAIKAARRLVAAIEAVAAAGKSALIRSGYPQ